MNNLRYIRESFTQLSARELGELIGAAESTVTAWERGTRGLNPSSAKKIIAALKSHGVLISLDAMYESEAA